MLQAKTRGKDRKKRKKKTIKKPLPHVPHQPPL
jgi:hypothetical protein